MINPVQRLRQWVFKRAVHIAHPMSDVELLAFTVKTCVERAASLPPADGLRFLLNVETALYPEQGRLAIAYGGGIHTKHRHMRYHDFFVARVPAGAHVLDIGCGIGTVAYDLAAKARATVVGIDLSPDNIATAKQRFYHPNVRFIVGNVMVDLPGERFDVVILSNVLEHLPMRPAFLRNVQQRTGAKRFLIRVPLFERDWRVPLKKELGVEWRLDETHETEYTLESFATEMAEAKLVPIHQEVRWGEIWSELNVDGEAKTEDKRHA